MDNVLKLGSWFSVSCKCGIITYTVIDAGLSVAQPERLKTGYIYRLKCDEGWGNYNTTYMPSDMAKAITLDMIIDFYVKYKDNVFIKVTNVAVPTVTVTPITYPVTPAMPDISFAMPAVPSVPSVSSLSSVIPGFPPVIPDIGALQGMIDTAVNSAKTAIQSELTSAKSQVKDASAMLKAKTTEFKESKSSMKLAFLETIKDRAPTKKEMAVIKMDLKNAEDEFKAVKEVAAFELDKLTTSIGLAPIKMKELEDAATAAFDGLKSNLANLTSLLD